MKEEIYELINTQIQKEFESAYLYLGFSSYFDSIGLSGFAYWFKIQAKEENEHALKFYDFLMEQNLEIKLLPITFTQKKYDSPGKVLEMALQHEQYITTLIHEIYHKAEVESDYATCNFLNWFISEQRDEELQAQILIDKYKLYGKTPESLYFLDKEFGKRKAA